MRPALLFRPRLLRVGLLTAAAAFALAGCDDRVFYDRDFSVPVHRGMTWAWRPAGAYPSSSGRRVVSRDVIGPNRESRRDSNWERDALRSRIAYGIEQNLAAKGLAQVGDPSQADFLVDFQFAVHRRRERVATPVYNPGLVCGYYGCWDGFYGGTYIRTVQYHEGTIVFDLFDQRGGRPAYHAVRENVVHADTFHEGEVNEGVRHLLKGLKPN